MATALVHKLRLGGRLLAQLTHRETTTAKPRTGKVTAALVSMMSLKEPGVVYDLAKASDSQDIPIMAECDPDAMLWQEQALKTRTDTPNLTPALTRTGYQYQTTWVRPVLISDKRKIHVPVHRHVGIEGRLAAYDLVGPTWQLNVIDVHVPFSDAMDTFLEHLMEAYRQLAMMQPTVIIGDFNAAPTMDDRGGQPTPEDMTVRMAMQHLDLQDLTTSLRGQASYWPPQPGSTDSRIDLCYADPTHVEVTQTKYHDLPSKATGHRPA